jgi:hypothetical protein
MWYTWTLAMKDQWALQAIEMGDRRGGAARILRAFRAILPAEADVRLVSTEGRWADLEVAGQRVCVWWLTSGIPSEVRLLAEKKHRPDVVVARLLTPGTKESLSAQRIGWIDETGAAEIALGTIVVSRSGRPIPRSPRRERWAPAVLSVAEALLCGVQATVEATRRATGLSGGACGNALRLLTDVGLLTAGAARGPASGRQMRDKRVFAGAYASQATMGRRTLGLVLGVTWRDPVRGLTELGHRWTAQGIDWVATGPVAAAIMAPLLTTVGSAAAYVDAVSIADLEAVASRSDLRPIEGGRLTIAPFPTVSTRRLAQTIDGLRVAPWPRVYADLRVSGVRGEEAAEHLLEVMDDKRA